MTDKHEYSSQLTEAAEEFLMRIFSGIDSEQDATAIEAAMFIVCGICWIQPTDAQIDLWQRSNYGPVYGSAALPAIQRGQ